MKVAGFVATDRRACQMLTAESVEEVLGAVLSETGYREVLADSEIEEDQNRLANIEELLTDARQFDERIPKRRATLEDYLESTWLVNDTDGWEAESDKVTLMTLHAAKGLEFPVVFFVAVEAWPAAARAEHATTPRTGRRTSARVRRHHARRSKSCS